MDWLNRIRNVFSRPRKKFLLLGGSCDGVCLHISFGTVVPRMGRHRAVLGPCDPERILEIIGFAAHERLPIDRWCVSGIGSFPGGQRRAAAWLRRLLEEAGPVPVTLLAGDLPPRRHARLLGHLARHGCIHRL